MVGQLCEPKRALGLARAPHLDNVHKFHKEEKKEKTAKKDVGWQVAQRSTASSSTGPLLPQEESKRKKDEKMKRRHQLDIIFAQFDKDGSGDSCDER